MKKNIISALLLAAVILSSCGEAAQTAAVSTTALQESAQPENTTAAETEPDPFESFDYGGESIRIHISSNDATGFGAADFLLAGVGEETGDVVNDSVFFRNRKVEELLNVKLEYTALDANFSDAPVAIKKIVGAGEDAYDLFINDLFPVTNLVLQGYFLDLSEAPYFDWTKDYWYEGYMSELSLDGVHRYQMAGDYFIDVLRSSHALYFNRRLAQNYFEDPDVFYKAVLDNKWTCETFLSYIEKCYLDLNGNSAIDRDDQFGFTVCTRWGGLIPWIIACDLTYVEPDGEGGLNLAMNNERSVKTLEMMNRIFYSGATDCSEVLGASDVVKDSLNMFKEGRALILGYQRLGTAEVLRDMEDEIGVLPYPKLDENQEKYMTSTHDTTEIGVIPITCTKFDTLCAVIEVLNRETKNFVLPAYYETGLKVKYTRDDLSGQMIDLIRANIGGSFVLAYANKVNNAFISAAFQTPLVAQSTDFASNYAKIEKSTQKQLSKVVATFSEIGQ